MSPGILRSIFIRHKGNGEKTHWSDDKYDIPELTNQEVLLGYYESGKEWFFLCSDKLLFKNSYTDELVIELVFEDLKDVRPIPFLLEKGLTFANSQDLLFIKSAHKDQYIVKLEAGSPRNAIFKTIKFICNSVPSGKG